MSLFNEITREGNLKMYQLLCESAQLLLAELIATEDK